MKINPTLKKIPVLILCFFIHQNFYCQKIDDIILNFQIINFDVKKNKTETVFEIINNSKENLKANNWELHWNQMKGFITNFRKIRKLCSSPPFASVSSALRTPSPAWPRASDGYAGG